MFKAPDFRPVQGEFIHVVITKHLENVTTAFENYVNDLIKIDIESFYTKINNLETKLNDLIDELNEDHL